MQPKRLIFTQVWADYRLLKPTVIKTRLNIVRQNLLLVTPKVIVPLQDNNIAFFNIGSNPKFFRKLFGWLLSQLFTIKHDDDKDKINGNKTTLKVTTILTAYDKNNVI